MVSVDFARTKIQPPRPRPALLARERLAAPLAAALAEYPLTLLCAPAGFGKTVALAEQLARWPAGQPLAWIAVDTDDDLARFAACLVAALDPFDLPWRVSPDALVAELGERPAAGAAFAIELSNALDATDLTRGLIVIDDLQRVDDDAVFALLERLIDRLPARWGFVLATRVDPPLPLARWRARGLMAEWRQDLLRFTTDEVTALAAARGRADAAALYERTGGWAAGLGLLLGARAAPGAPAVRDRPMFDFLASEVLDEMPAALREFLLRSSVLPELSARRCAEVTGQPDAAALLAEIDRRGLFVSVLDEREPTLRLHDLFRDFLEDRLRRERADEWPRLLHRAAAGEADPVRRIGYLARAGAWAEAEAALCEIGPARIAAGAVPQVLRLIESFPPRWLEDSPSLQHLRGLCAWAHWDWNGMGEAMSRAAAGHARHGQTALARRSEVIAAFRDALVTGADDGAAGLRRLDGLAALPLDGDTRVLLAMARAWHHLAHGALDLVAEPFSTAVDLLEEAASPTLWFQCMPATAFLGLPGIRPALRRYVAGALAHAPEEPPSAMRVLAEAMQAGLELFAGQTDDALARLDPVAADCRWLNSPPTPSTYVATVGAFAHALRGDAGAALASAQALIDGLQDGRSSGRRAIWLNHYRYLRLRVAAILDDADSQREMAAQLQVSVQPAERPVFVRQRGALAARLAALDGRWRDAARGFEQALADEVALDHYGQAGELRVRWAQALLQDGRTDEAAAAFRPASARAFASGEVAGMRFAGAFALGTLADARWGARLDAPQLQWLRAAAQRSGRAMAGPGGAPGAPAGGAALTPREAEVLARLAAGDSNKLIARALDLSPHTVKRHVANILDKLGLNSRVQAATWQREHRR